MKTAENGVPFQAFTQQVRKLPPRLSHYSSILTPKVIHNNLPQSVIQREPSTEESHESFRGSRRPKNPTSHSEGVGDRRIPRVIQREQATEESHESFRGSRRPKNPTSHSEGVGDRRIQRIIQREQATEKSHESSRGSRRPKNPIKRDVSLSPDKTRKSPICSGKHPLCGCCEYGNSIVSAGEM